MKGKHWLLLGLILCQGISACTTSRGSFGSPTPPPSQNKVTSTASPTAPPRETPPNSPPTLEPPKTNQALEENLPTQQPCWTKGGYVDRYQMETPSLDKPLEYRVYLPPCYYHHAERQYPVLYLLHGLYYNDSQWDRLGVDETANALISSGDLPPFIIVMPRDRDWEVPPTNKFGEVLVTELILRVDKQFRTIPSREYRAIGGLSRGGNWALHLGFQYWGIFGALGAHSAPVFITDGPRIPEWLDEIPAKSMPRIFLDIGDHDLNGVYLHEVEKMLSERGIPHEWYLNTGRHNEDYWQANLEMYLRWYAQPWKE